MVIFGTMLGEWDAGESAPLMLAKYRDDLRDRIFAELNALNALQ